MTEQPYQTILVERDGRVGLITLNRPKALNALNSQVMDEVTAAAKEFDDDPGIGAIVLTGSEKAFAAGADIKEMADLSFADVFGSDFFAKWGEFAATRTHVAARRSSTPENRDPAADRVVRLRRQAESRTRRGPAQPRGC